MGNVVKVIGRRNRGIKKAGTIKFRLFIKDGDDLLSQNL